jgi:hypothetical protein
VSAAEGVLDPVQTLRETIAALSVLDAEALETLRVNAVASRAVGPLDAEVAVEMRSLHSALSRLLNSTARNLTTLRALHDTAIAVAQEAGREAAWAR